MLNTELEEDLYAEPEIPPHSVGIEQAVLTGLFQDPEAIHEVIDLIKPEFFYLDAHRAIYRACVRCYREETRVDNVSIFDALREAKELEDCGGSSYLADLATKCLDVLVTSENIRYWGKKLRDYAQRRELWKAGYELIGLAKDRQNPDFMNHAHGELMGIEARFTEPEGKRLGEMTDLALRNITDRLTNPSGLTGLATGFKALDAKTHGLQNGNLVILGARPSIGKTAMALNIASNCVFREKRPVLFFSLEMNGEELMERVLKSQAETSSSLQKLEEAAEAIKSYQGQFLIDDGADKSLLDIQACAQKTKAKKPDLGLIIVDHLALVRPHESKRFQNRNYELEEISWGLKAMAKTLQVPVLLLCQLNRAIEGRQDKKPMLSDLRDSGAIEQNADLVLFLSGERESPERVLTIAKHRNGPLGELPLLFLGHLTRFLGVNESKL